MDVLTPVHADGAQGVFDAFDSQALHRIYARARHMVGARIAIDEEIERRLAVIVLFNYRAEAQASAEPTADEDAIAEACCARLMATTTTVA